MEGEVKSARSFEYPKEGVVPRTDTERERRKTAKKITDCIMSILSFWRICTKKKKNKPKGTRVNTL